MTKLLALRSFLVLLIASCSAAGRRLLSVHDLLNVTVSDDVQQNNATTLRPTGRPPQTTGIREDGSSASLTPSRNVSEMTRSWPSQGTASSGNVSKIGGSETNATEDESPGTENPFPERNATSGPSLSISTPTIPASTGANATGSGADVPPSHLTTETSNTTAEVRTTSSRTPYRSQKPDKTTPRSCPTAEPKRESLVSRCLIAIASLTALATIFIMTTIILATKLAGLKQRHRESLLRGTEMVCISALMNDSEYPIPAPRRPKSNGALIPITEDGDGDDLTLNSFLPDTEGAA